MMIVGDAENYKRCRLALEILKHETDAKGRSLTIHKLHLPPPMVCFYYTLWILYVILYYSHFMVS